MGRQMLAVFKRGVGVEFKKNRGNGESGEGKWGGREKRGGLLDHPDAASKEIVGFIAVDVHNLLVDVVGRLICRGNEACGIQP